MNVRLLSLLLLTCPALALADDALTPSDIFGRLPQTYENDSNPVTEAKVALGRMLFFDKRLSKNHDVSCNSCHDLAHFGVDGQTTSKGHKGKHGDRNSPTVFNAGDHVAQFWDGRAATLEEQAKGPVLNPIEMAMPNAETVTRVLESIPGYAEPFQKAFPEQKAPITFDNAAMAIAAFERKLITPARLDKYLAGDAKALSDLELAGLKDFMTFGCTTCHNGQAVGGQSFQRLGQVEPYPDQSDLGRFKVTKDDEDRMKFRVPSLRNIAKTAPYFHNGKLKKLEDVVKTMARYQLGKKLTPKETKELVAFLTSLTGELPKDLIAPPTLPPSGPQTPRPDPT